MKLNVKVGLYGPSYCNPYISHDLDIDIGQHYSDLEKAIEDCGGEEEFLMKLAMALGQAREHQNFCIDQMIRQDIIGFIRKKLADKKHKEKVEKLLKEANQERDKLKVEVCELQADIKKWECESEGMMRIVRAHEGKPTDLDVQGDHSECREDVVLDIQPEVPEE